MADVLPAARVRRRQRERLYADDLRIELGRIEELAAPFRHALDALRAALAAGDLAALQRAFGDLSAGARAFRAIDTIAVLIELRIAEYRKD